MKWKMLPAEVLKPGSCKKQWRKREIPFSIFNNPPPQPPKKKGLFNYPLDPTKKTLPPHTSQWLFVSVVLISLFVSMVLTSKIQTLQKILCMGAFQIYRQTKFSRNHSSCTVTLLPPNTSQQFTSYNLISIIWFISFFINHFFFLNPFDSIFIILSYCFPS